MDKEACVRGSAGSRCLLLVERRQWERLVPGAGVALALLLPWPAWRQGDGGQEAVISAVWLTVTKEGS